MKTLPPRVRRALLAALVAPALLVASPARADGDEETPRVLLSDFGAYRAPRAALVEALADFEARRADPASGLRGDAPDARRAAALLDAAQALE